MKKEEQYKLWHDLSEGNRTHYREQYAEQQTMPESGVPKLLEELFGDHNLKSLRTYEDAARELFMDNKRVYFFGGDEYHRANCNVHCVGESWYKAPMNCASEAQTNKLIAINKLLNVAKLLNRNDDGSDWVPDWTNMNEPKFYPVIKEGSLMCWEVHLCRSHIVYFRTIGIFRQAVQILGEEEIMKALTTGY